MRHVIVKAILIASVIIGASCSPSGAPVPHAKVGAIVNPPLPPSITGSGTANSLVLWSGTTTQAAAGITDSGTLILIGSRSFTVGSGNIVTIGSATSFTNGNTVKISGHVVANGTAQSSGNLSSCGTSPAILSTSTDDAGTITEGSTATGCVMAFALTFGVAPTCTCAASTAISVGCSATATALTIVNASATGDVIHYTCIGAIGST
jgi:hypothetical protein